jgi:hypothetical protein
LGFNSDFRDRWRGGSLELPIHIRCVGDALAFRNAKKGRSSFLPRPRCRPTAWSWLASWAAAFSKISLSRGFAASASVALGCSSLKIGAHARSGAGEPDARFLRQFDQAGQAVSARQHKPAKIAKTFVRIDGLEAGRLGKRFALCPGPAGGITWKPCAKSDPVEVCATGRPRALSI